MKNFFADIAKSADKFAVLEKYFYQDDAAIRKKNGEQNRQLYQKILTRIIQQTKKKILVVTADEHDRKNNIAEIFIKKPIELSPAMIHSIGVCNLPVEIFSLR